MKKRITQALLFTGVLTTMAWAQGTSQTPKRETLEEAIRFEKYKVAAGEAQARKDAGGTFQISETKPSAAKKARRQGQADSAKRSTAPSK